VLYDEADHAQDVSGLQAQINQINTEITQIEAITDRIDFTQSPLLVGDLVVTNDNKNSVLLTAIQNLQSSIGELNKLDLSALPSIPAGACVITTPTTNQALKALIDGHDANIAKFDLTAMPAAPPASITITPATTNQALKILIDNINTSITNINTKIAHWNNFTFGSDSMCGVNDGTGFAVALSGSASGNGIFVYPNNTSVTEQITLVSAQDKEIFIRGGDAVKIYGATNGSIGDRNRVEIGDSSDIIALGVNSTATLFPEIEIGVDGTALIKLDSSTTIKGDLYFSNQVASTGIYNVMPYTPVMVADTHPTADFGNCNNFTTDPTFSGLDVLAPAGLAPITLSAGIGLIMITALAGGITLQTGGGVMTLSCGAGGFFLNSGVGVMNFASGSGNINTTTISGDIVLGAGKAVGGTAGNTILNALQKVTIQPDIETEIYKAAFVELNDNATAPPVTANRLYQQADALYWNGQLVQGGSGNQYVLKAGDTMTGTLVLPEADTSILTLQNLTTAPSPVTNRLYLLNNVLTFNGVAVGGGAGTFLPLTGGTLTGQLISSYDAGQVTPQLQLTNTNATAPVGGQGAAINLRNDSAGAGSIGERCGKIDFAARDSASAGGRTYAAIQGYINDPTSTAIDGRLSHFVASNNTLSEMFRLISTSTSVRQANIGATYTTIGATAIGSTATSTLTIQGTTNSTTSIQTPEINNCPAIYPATSSTLVDNAVRQYRPERLYKLDDYPSPLTAPTMDGEKVFILNKAGSPSGLDQIWANADFPNISGATISQVIQAKYVDSTLYTPAANYITTLYSDNVCRVFVQADIAGSPLTLTLVCSCLNSVGNTGILDFVVTTYSTQHRLYFGGLFNTLTLTLAGGNVVTANNFSSQITMVWGASGITSQTHLTMTSSSTTQDTAVGQTFSNIEGLNAMVNCLVNMTGNTTGFSQPTPPANQKYDSIVIAGDFMGINQPTPQRSLRRMAYYDWTPSGVTNTTLYSPTGLLPNQTSYFYSALGGQSLAGSPNGSPTTTTYSTISITATMEFLGAGVPPAPQAAVCCGIIKDYLGNLYATGDSQNITATGSQQLYTFTFSNITLQGGNLGQGYNYYIQVTNINDLPANSVTYLADNLGNLISTGTGSQLSGSPIGWRTFANSGWDTPVGGDGQVVGALGFDNGRIGFGYRGTSVIVAPQTAIGANYFFTMNYASGSATFQAVNGDDGAIQAGATIIGEKNCMTGGNPTLAYGAGNAIAYAEGYLNRFTHNPSLTGMSFRYTSQDPYVVSNNLIVINGGTAIAASQLFPQFGSPENCEAVYRDDTKYPNMYFIAQNTETKTATLPWSQGSAPNYNSIGIPPSSPLPALGFAGYSDEVGYQGLVIFTQSPANGYLYKGGAAGELVVDLSGCVVRTSGDTGSPVIATNKLTFPAAEDGTSIMLLGDTQLVGGKPSWWAVSQDGIVIFDTTTINSRGDGSGITSVTATGSGITATTANNAVTIANTGVTSIIAGTNVTISGATGDVTINASAAAAGVTSLSIPTPATGNQQPLYLQPFQATTGALTLATQPTKAQFFANFNGFGEYGQLNVVNGQSIFQGMNGADASGKIPATPVSFFQNISPFAIMTNTSVYFKFTCSLSFAGEAGWNPSIHYLYLNFLFTNTSQQQTQYAQGNIQGEGGVVASYSLDGQSTLKRMNATWSDVFSVAAQEGTSNQIMLSNQFSIRATTNYTFQQNLTGTIYWTLEYIPNP
jgi:hypothetical protein